jgi:prepilin-type N-terminal cleavage/methylation domain-containing protein/prepilin-type processing-associated H-X9-DG protein
MTRNHVIRSRRGFSLIELMAVLGILGVLIGLLLPAVQQARESARRLECQSRLAEIGKALNAHAAGVGAYPYVAYGWGVHDPGWPVLSAEDESRNYGPFVALLPYLDERPVFDSFNFDAHEVRRTTSLYSPFPANTTAAAVRLRIFLCPSDPASPSSPVARWGGTNYRCNVGLTGVASLLNGIPTMFFYPRWRGAFEYNEALTTADFPDGLSRTVFVSEKPRSRKGARFDPHADFWNSTALPQNQDELIDACSALRGLPSVYSNLAGASWLMAGKRCSAYGHDLPPNSPIPDCAVSWENQHDAMVSCITARSFHQGGVNALFGDGHVEVVGDGIGTAVWRALGTRDGNDF